MGPGRSARVTERESTNMRSRILRNFGFAVAALAVPALSLAQAQANSPEQIDEVRKEASAHLGPFYVTPKIFLKELGVDGVFTDFPDAARAAYK